MAAQMWPESFGSRPMSFTILLLSPDADPSPAMAALVWLRTLGSKAPIARSTQTFRRTRMGCGTFSSSSAFRLIEHKAVHHALRRRHAGGQAMALARGRWLKLLRAQRD